jgi:hypothetical protein
MATAGGVLPTIEEDSLPVPDCAKQTPATTLIPKIKNMVIVILINSCFAHPQIKTPRKFWRGVLYHAKFKYQSSRLG